jgi:hypothetical protein
MQDKVHYFIFLKNKISLPASTQFWQILKYHIHIDLKFHT